MKSHRYLPLALAAVLSLAGATLLWAAEGAQDRKVAQLEEELQKLRSDRVTTSLLEVGSQRAAYQSGTVTLDQLLDAYEHLVEDRLALATKFQERITALEEFVGHSREIEQQIEALYKTGSRGGESNSYARVKRARQTAEIKLLEETLREARGQ
jgi:hypothetical protein